MRKSALEAVKANGILPSITYGLGASVGRLQALPAALAVGQEKALDWLRDPDEAQVSEIVNQMKHDPRLENTVVRLAHSDPIDDFKRIWKNKQNTLLDKAVGTLAEIPTALQVSLGRADHYNPYTDAVGIYGNIPEILHHELGHAKELNSHKGLARLFRKPATIAENFLGARYGITAGPLTQWAESMANSNAEKDYKGDPREFRRRLWPARSTYIGALLTSLGMLHPGMRQKILSVIGPKAEDSAGKLALKLLAPAFAAGGIGRLAAETRNLFDSGKRKEDESR